MPTSTAAIIATVVASLGVLSGAILSNTQTTKAEPQAAIAQHLSDHAHLGHSHDASEDNVRGNYLKPGADAILLSPHSIQLDKSQLQKIPLVIKVPPALGELNIEIKVDSPLTIQGQKEFSFQTGQQSAVELTVELSAQQDGEFPVHIFTQFVDEYGNTSARAMAVAAKVGLVNALKLHAKSQVMVSQPVEFIKLPGEETIR